MGAAIQLDLLEPAGEALPERVAEWLMPRAGGAWLARSMPLLSDLDGETPQRWLTWVHSGTRPLLAASTGRRHTRAWRQVLAASREEAIERAERALAAGTSHTVILLVEQRLEGGAMARLEHAARVGQCFCLLLRRL